MLYAWHINKNFKKIDIKFGNRLYSKEKRPGSTLLSSFQYYCPINLYVPTKKLKNEVQENDLNISENSKLFFYEYSISICPAIVLPFFGLKSLEFRPLELWPLELWPLELEALELGPEIPKRMQSTYMVKMNKRFYI